MLVYGLDFLQAILQTEGFFFKLVANENGVFFFPHTAEHRDAKVGGLSYEDDSAGNALAATVKPGRIDFRFHRSFSEERVQNIARRIIAHPEIPFSEGGVVTYGGRVILSGSDSQEIVE